MRSRFPGRPCGQPPVQLDAAAPWVFFLRCSQVNRRLRAHPTIEANSHKDLSSASRPDYGLKRPSTYVEKYQLCRNMMNAQSQRDASTGGPGSLTRRRRSVLSKQLSANRKMAPAARPWRRLRNASIGATRTGGERRAAARLRFVSQTASLLPYDVIIHV